MMLIVFVKIMFFLLVGIFLKIINNIRYMNFVCVYNNKYLSYYKSVVYKENSNYVLNFFLKFFDIDK